MGGGGAGDSLYTDAVWGNRRVCYFYKGYFGIKKQNKKECSVRKNITMSEADKEREREKSGQRKSHFPAA